MIRKLAVTAALGAILAGLSAAESQARAPRAFYGVTPQTELSRVDYRQMERGRVGTLRVELHWGNVDPPSTEAELFANRPPYRWKLIDPTVRRAAQHGIQILPTVYGTPHWVARYQGCESLCHKVGPNTTIAYYAFDRFLRAAVKRYGPHGQFWDDHRNLPYRPIRVWQIWNEQNSSDYWKPFPNVQDYGNLLTVAGEAIHKVDRRAQVIPGGMIGEPSAAGKKTVAGWDFLFALYANPHARAAFNGVAIHPYGAGMRGIKRTVWRWRQTMAAAGAPNDPIWVTEIGWASGGAKHPLNRGLAGQAERIDEALAYFTEKRRRLNFRLVNIFAWRDAAPGADQCAWCKRSGLIRFKDRVPKPAWDVYKTYTGGR